MPTPTPLPARKSAPRLALTTMPMRMRSSTCGLLFLCYGALLGPLLGCSSESATEADCEAILAKIVELEVREQGYRDPVLLERKQATLRRNFADEVESCVGRRLPAGALACVDAASSAEEISHICLR